MRDVSNKTKLAALDWWQNRAFQHPLTCMNDSDHRNLIAGETSAGKLYLECPDCDYIQTWFPEYVWGLFLNHMAMGASLVGLDKED